MKTRAIKFFKRLAAVVLCVPALALASEAVHYDSAPVKTDQESLQRGAKLFINHCLNCHSASMVRYNQLQKIGLTEDMIAKNLLFTGEKVGELMMVALKGDDAEKWFGTVPPDLSVMSRAKGADYLYTYLRSFFRDPERPTGWNNTVFDKVGMPHVLWELQGEQTLTAGEHGGKLVLTKPGQLTKEQYDADVADIVSFMVWMGDPSAGTRKTIGIFVLIFLALFWVLTHKLGKSYWKDIH